MAKVQRIPLGRKQGQRRIELPDQVQVSLAELAGRTRQGLLAFAVGVGMEVFHTLLAEDVTSIVGPKGRHNPDRVATGTLPSAPRFLSVDAGSASTSRGCVRSPARR